MSIICDVFGYYNSETGKPISSEEAVYLINKLSSNNMVFENWLPQNCIRYKDMCNGIDFHILNCPGNKMSVNFKDKFYTVPGLNTLFIIRYDKNRDAFDRSNSKCFVYLDNELTIGTQLYKYPYGNVYSNGKICFGSSDKMLPKLKPHELGTLIYVFLNSRSNNDISPNVERSRNIASVEQVLKIVDGKDRFDESLLLKAYVYE